MSEIDPHIELHITQARKEDRKEYEGLFATKWVEAFAKWLIIAVGSIIVATLFKLK